MYGFPAERVHHGMRLEEIVMLSFSLGNHPKQTPREPYQTYTAELMDNRDGARTNSRERLSGGRIIETTHIHSRGLGWVVTHEDVTEQLKTDAQIRHLARQDMLTNLPNRVQFLRKLRGLKARLERGERAAILCVDLDCFKAVNNTLGHTIGDKLLKQVSARLLRSTREGDVLARMGGDEFAVLLSPVDALADAAAVAGRVVKAIAAPFMIEGHQILIGASVGIAVAPDHGETPDLLMRNADLACCDAREAGRSTHKFFAPGMRAALERCCVIEAGLRQALEQEKFRLMFQPLLGLKEERITCVEALLRWDHPELGNISPVDFIPVAEETGLIVQIGEWALRRACKAAASWPGDIRVAVNLSPVQFRNRKLGETVRRAFTDAGLPPTRLELEITESLLLTDIEQTLEILHELRELGVRMAMDDFGIGYSSLSYLRSFPFDKIKIDRSFVRDLESNTDNLAIIRAIIELGHSLCMSVVVEGVETEAQLQAVRQLGCDEVQGFLFSAPLSLDEVRRLLEGKPGGFGK